MPVLERQLQTELNASWTVRRTGGAERRILKVCVLRRVVGAERKAVGYVPIRVIERVEELSVDVQPQPLVEFDCSWLCVMPFSSTPESAISGAPNELLKKL